MNICLCFGYFPDKIEGKIVRDTKAYLQNSANVLQKRFIEGISSHFRKITIVNAPFVGYYGLKYRSIRVPSCYEHLKVDNADIDIRSFSFNTLLWATHKERKIKCKREVQKWLKMNEGEHNAVVVYSLHMDFISACVELKEKHEFKLVVIVPDLPRYMNSSSKWYSRLHSKFNKLFAEDRTTKYSQIDAFVYLTEQMDKQICRESKPYVVIEGIANVQNNTHVKATERKKYILYTGTMAKKYGVLQLVEAFKLMRNNKDYKLCLCGSGDGVDEILQASQTYNIDYRGEILNRTALDLQKYATLLVNPRPDEGEYTKYSFPSKVMEYFASGTPTIMHRLSGIPDEYYNYCFSFSGSDVGVMASDMDEVIESSEQKRLALGDNARLFVQTQKNPSKQCEKLITLLDSLFC